MWFRLTLLAASALFLAGCAGQQSALDPQGPHAAQLASLFWIFTAICSAIWPTVMIVLAIGVIRRASLRPDPLQLDAGSERRSVFVVSGAAAATALTVIALTALSYVSQRRLFAHEKPAITIKVTGLQWWWDVRYETESPDFLNETPFASGPSSVTTNAVMKTSVTSPPIACVYVKRSPSADST